MKVTTHPNHIKVNNFSTESTYAQTMNRFEDILENKLGVVQKTKPISNKVDLKKKTSADKKDYKAEEVSKNVKNKSLDVTEKINKFFKDTPMKNLGAEFEAAQDKYGVNAFFLASVAALESGKGTSKIAQDKKNLFGFKAYDHNPYASAEKFENFADGIDKVAKYLSEEYLHENGKYYFGDSIEDINQNYATDKEWNVKVNNIMTRMME